MIEGNVTTKKKEKTNKRSRLVYNGVRTVKDTTSKDDRKKNEQKKKTTHTTHKTKKRPDSLCYCSKSIQFLFIFSYLFVYFRAHCSAYIVY